VVDGEDIRVPPSSPEPIGHTTVQHVNDPDFINDPDEDNRTSNSDSPPFLCEPEPNFFGETTLPSISLIGAAALKQLVMICSQC